MFLPERSQKKRQSQAGYIIITEIIIISFKAHLQFPSWCINNSIKNNEIFLNVDDVIWHEDEMRPPLKIG